jgi:hypothetical protein
MSEIKITFGIVLQIVLVLSIFDTYAIAPNPLISRNKPVFGSPSTNVSNLVNGKFGETWSVSNGSWAAIQIGGNYTKVLVNWNNTGYSWSDSIASATSCKSNMAIPVDYDLLTSSNSTNGTDGTWTVALSIKKNSVTARAHIIDFTGSQWIKMSITKGGGSIDEIEVFEMAAESNDTWFFAGTSISANSFKATPPAKSFADLITESHASFTPAIIRGGIPCINSTTMINDITKYLAIAGNVKYWAIEMGTNDAWGGTNSNVATYKANMQKVIDSCKARGIEPIISRIIGTDSAKAKWQVHPDFLKAIDSLTVKNKLIPGPDLYTYFSKHTSELEDGVHPTATGGATVFRLWAQKMDSLYSAGSSKALDQSAADHLLSNNLCKISINSGSFFHVKDEGILSVYTLKGSLLKKVNLPANGSYYLTNTKGVFVVDFVSKVGKESFTLSNVCK